MEARGNMPIQDPTNRTVELKHRDQKQWLRGRKNEAEEPGKLTASHTLNLDFNLQTTGAREGF